MADAGEIFKRLRSVSDESSFPDVATRLDWLRSLKASLVANRRLIQEAVWNDFRKSSAEADLSEVMPVLIEIRLALRELKSWTAPKRIKGSFPFLGLSAKVEHHPKGVVLIISPWNYPFNLSLGPLVSALAAGNRAVIKPSERVPHCSRLIAEMVKRALPDDVATVLEGGPEMGDRLLKLPFDHFFVTGGERVGRRVAHAAASHMSTATLELGGKSPAIVDGTVDLTLCAERIIRGKFLNGGQTCIAPDYVVVRYEFFDRFLAEAVRQASRFESMAEISAPVDDDHAAHLAGLLDDSVAQGALLHRADQNRNGLTLVTGVPLTCRLMQEEIFGPILPVLRYGSQEELMGILKQNPTPLTTYVFSHDEGLIETVTREFRTGGLCINETLLHFAHPRLPFGGVGRSGYGRSHGRAGFETFSALLPTMRQNFRKGVLPLLYPPAGRVQDWARATLFRILGGQDVR